MIFIDKKYPLIPPLPPHTASPLRWAGVEAFAEGGGEFGGVGVVQIHGDLGDAGVALQQLLRLFHALQGDIFVRGFAGGSAKGAGEAAHVAPDFLPTHSPKRTDVA